MTAIVQKWISLYKIRKNECVNDIRQENSRKIKGF